MRERLGRKVYKRSSVKILMFLIITLFYATGCVKGETYSADTFQLILQNFYEATYIKSDLEQMKEPLVEEYKFYFEQAMTMAGMDKAFYKSYKEEAVDIFGEEFAIGVQINSFKEASATDKKDVENKFGEVNYAVDVEYDIIFKGKDVEEKYSNKLTFVNSENKWYMTSHLNLPIGRNVYAY